MSSTTVAIPSSTATTTIVTTAATTSIASVSGSTTTTTMSSTAVAIPSSTATTTIATTAATTPVMTSIPISVVPLFGPIAGGTRITITSPSTFDDISRYIGSTVTGVKTVYIGNDLSSTSVFLRNGSLTLDLVAITPSTTEGTIGQPLPIVIEFSPIPFDMILSKEFTYLPNPEITDLYPDSFIVDGGTLLEVTGRNLSSVAEPIIQLTVFVTRAAENGSTSNTTRTETTRVCTFPPGSDTYMECPMPPLKIPEDFLANLNLHYNLYPKVGERRKRDIDRSDISIANVSGPNGVDRADIYLGFIFDGYKEYENINDALPDTKFYFYSAPEINSSNDIIEFDPSEDDLIYVKGRYMLRGCRIRDYLVHIGNQICNNSDLQDNQLSCRPPKTQPSSTLNDTIYCKQHLSVSITLGYKQYQYACMTYTDKSRKVALIVGLTVGLGGGAILIAIIIACILCCRWRKGKKSTDKRGNSGRQEKEINEHYDNYVESEDQDGPTHNEPYNESIELGQDGEYLQQISQSDGYLKPNDGYLTASAYSHRQT